MSDYLKEIEKGIKTRKECFDLGYKQGCKDTEIKFKEWLMSLEYNDRYPVIFFEQIENKIKELSSEVKND